MIIATLMKDDPCHNSFLTNMFFPLVVKVFKC